MIWQLYIQEYLLNLDATKQNNFAFSSREDSRSVI